MKASFSNWIHWFGELPNIGSRVTIGRNEWVVVNLSNSNVILSSGDY